MHTVIKIGKQVLPIVFFLLDKKDARPNLTVKVLKRMHLDMKHGSFAGMSAECNRLGGSRKNI